MTLQERIVITLGWFLIVCVLVGTWGVVRAIEARSAERIAEIQARTEAERQKQFERLVRIAAGLEP